MARKLLEYLVSAEEIVNENVAEVLEGFGMSTGSDPYMNTYTFLLRNNVVLGRGRNNMLVMDMMKKISGLEYGLLGADFPPIAEAMRIALIAAGESPPQGTTFCCYLSNPGAPRPHFRDFKNLNEVTSQVILFHYLGFIQKKGHVYTAMVMGDGEMSPLHKQLSEYVGQLNHLSR